MHGMRSDARLCRSWAAWIAVLAVLLVLGGCRREPPEVRLRERIAQMQAAVEARNPGKFMDSVAEDFGSDSGMDRAALHNLLRAQVLRNASIGVSIGPLDVSIQGERASVSFSAMATGSQGGLLPDSARPWAVTTGWRDGPEGWQLIHAKWEPIL